MRILFVNPFWKPYMGGTERVIEKLTKEFNNNKSVDRVGLLTTYNYYPQGKVSNKPAFEREDGLDIFRLHFYPNTIPFITNIKNSGYVSLEINQVINKFKPDIIQFMTDGWYVANSQIYLQTKNYCSHCFTPFYHDIKPGIFTMPIILNNRWLFNSVNKIQVMSETEKQKIISLFQIPENKINTLSLGVEISTESKESHSIVKIVSVGRIGPAKGQLELVEIFYELTKKTNQEIELILVGSDGGDLDKIQHFIKEKHIEHLVTITGFVTDEQLKKLYNSADIFAHCTRYESFGLVAFDALAHHVPVITYAVGALPEVLKEGSILVPPFNKAIMLAELVKLVKNKNKRLSLGEAGFTYVKNNYSWNKVADNYLNIYRKIL